LDAQPAQDESDVSLTSFARDMANTSFHQALGENGGEGANRTLLDLQSKPTAVLKTARATRHPSLSREMESGENWKEKKTVQRNARTVWTMASGSGNSPVAFFE
jgi:hypothetical protein